MLRGQAQVPLAMLPRSSSVNQHCLPRASPARREESLREGTSQGLLLCNTPKNRVAALLPRTVSRTTRVEAGPPPPPPAWPARNLLLETQRRRREKDTSLGRLVKRVSRSKLLCAGAAGRPKALFRDVSYALILFLSTHGRELLAQTAKTKVPSCLRPRNDCPTCKEVGYDIKNDPLGVLCCVGWFAVCAASLAYLIYWIIMRAK